MSDWLVVKELPEEWPTGATVSIYPHTGNRMYNVPGDCVRYYEMLDGSTCHNCGGLIDKAGEIHAEDKVDRERNLCKKCWSDINHGNLDLPQIIDNYPIYRLRNTILSNP